MARKVLIYQKTDLTKESVLQDLKEHFTPQGKEVCISKYVGNQICVKETNWVGVIVRVAPKKDKTKIVLIGFIPSTFWRIMTAGGYIPYIILTPRWKSLMSKIEKFLNEKYSN